MIVVDASAVLAVILKEEEGLRFRDVFAKAPRSLMSAVNYWEVLVRAQGATGAVGVATADDVIKKLNIEVAPVDAALARAAAEAFARFKGRAGGRLNLGDCFAYALAQSEGDGLLFKGDDFPKTDVKSVL